MAGNDAIAALANQWGKCFVGRAKSTRHGEERSHRCTCKSMGEMFRGNGCMVALRFLKGNPFL